MLPASSKRRGATRQPRPRQLRETPDEENLPTEIQGKAVDSREEAIAALALEFMGHRFIYQKAYFGGERVPGGIVVDFLILTTAMPTPMSIKSVYWHEIRNRQDLDVIQAGKLSRIPGLASLVEVDGAMLQSVEQAIRTLTQVIGLP